MNDTATLPDFNRKIYLFKKDKNGFNEMYEYDGKALTEKEWKSMIDKNKFLHGLIKRGFLMNKERRNKMTEETIRLNREDLKDLKEKGFITRERFADVSKTKRWKPKKGEKYYAICRNGRIDYYIWDSDSGYDLCFKLVNCFKTEEEAQKDIDRRIAEQELLDLCDWKTGIVYYIEYNLANKFFDIDWCFTFTSPYRFASEESARKAINQLGEDKLKLIFRIGETK